MSINVPWGYNHHHTNDYKISFVDDTLRIDNYSNQTSLGITDSLEPATELDESGLRFPQVLVRFFWRYDHLLIEDRKSRRFVKFQFEDRQFSNGIEEPSGRDSEETFIDWLRDGVLIANKTSGQWVKLYYSGNVTCSEPLENTLPMN
jgi:hypothetical protein